MSSRSPVDAVHMGVMAAFLAPVALFVVEYAVARHTLHGVLGAFVVALVDWLMVAVVAAFNHPLQALLSAVVSTLLANWPSAGNDPGARSRAVRSGVADTRGGPLSDQPYARATGDSA